MSCCDDCPVADPGFSRQRKHKQGERHSFDVRMAEMAGPAEPNSKKAGKESKWKGSQSKFPHIFIKLKRALLDEEPTMATQPGERNKERIAVSGQACDH